jgi:hypothetical protein
MSERRIPNDQLREAFLRSRLTPTELAVRLGWERKASGRAVLVPDSGSVTAVLGLRSMTTYQGGKRRTYKNRTVTASRAHEIGDALHLDPVDYGL